MEKEQKIVLKNGEGEIEEKKSRFIAAVYAVDDEEEIQTIIEQTKKKYWDARHNCYAYVLDGGRIMRYSDDGEPSGTAGKPMLEILQSEGVDQCLVIVTRYFGGTLLGTGGLVRAYQQATKAGLENATLAVKKNGVMFSIDTDYNDLGKIQYYIGCSESGMYISDIEYTDRILMKILVEDSLKENFNKKMVEITSGKALIDVQNGIDFAVADGKPLLL